ncbi:lipopolysaccharide heptosyltransferase 1 [Haemophilus paracuniculus]|uniref:Lipopolysaccharide heptosyltransferase 1 n=1 Tax=Haemophilus paracuniculus TaxID=734 RepID=A0A1T0AQ50_9PAST|nr:lipopolysaccharide heptosyltransferase RfaC [Haemophilus paracuniculus]OOR98254.1 lipopolysaccharide heptosyltransferase 1 [Haemophilus paracuniculus]
MKICLVKTSSMGDVIHALPALTDAQRAIPDLQVDWVVERAFAEIPQWHSAVRNVVPVAIRQWRKRLVSPQTWQEWRAYVSQLKSEKYEAVIDAQGLLKSAVLATRLANGTKHGYDKNSAREGLSACFYDKKYAIPYQQHAVERIRKLFAQSLGYDLPNEVGDYDIARHFAKNSANLTACKPYVVAIHATTRADKHWTEQAWAALFSQICQTGVEVHLPWGNLAEKARAERLAQSSPLIKVLPKLTLTPLAQHLAEATAVVSVDTGLSHLTAALDKPNIILYGATDPNLIGAYGKNQHYLTACSMAEISAEQVWDRLSDLLPK